MLYLSGYGTSINQSDKGTAIEKAKKEAVTDAMKRALRLFGNGLGLTIYDKQYISDIRSGKIHSEALDLTRNDTLTTEELNAFETSRKRMKAEPTYDSSYTNTTSNVPQNPVIQQTVPQQSTNTYNNNTITTNIPAQQQSNVYRPPSRQPYNSAHFLYY